MKEDVADVGGKENSELGSNPVDGGVLELFELLGLIDPVVDPADVSFTPHDHLLLLLLLAVGLRGFFVVPIPDEGL